jgi:hypothetical protein
MGIDAKASTKFIRVFKTLSEKRFIDPRISSSEKAESDLRLGTVKRLSQDRVVFVPHRSNRARGCVFDFENVAPVDPKVATTDSGGAALSDTHLAFFHNWFHANLHARF